MLSLREHLVSIDKLGLHIFKVTSVSSIFPYNKDKDSPGTIYWADPKMPRGVGPFKSIEEALANYNETQVAFDHVQEVTPGVFKKTVVRVDFKNKRRIEPLDPLKT